MPCPFSAVDKAIAASLEEARLAMTNFVADVLGAYRKEINAPIQSGVLLAPETLKLLPLFINSLVKHASREKGWVKRCP